MLLNSEAVWLAQENVTGWRKSKPECTTQPPERTSSTSTATPGRTASITQTGLHPVLLAVQQAKPTAAYYTVQ
jgi:hypothetical protein